MSVEAVQAALQGSQLDVVALERLVFDPEYALSVRNKLVPLLVQLAEVNPQAASEVPEPVVTALFRGMAFTQVLKLTQLNVDHLQFPLIRPLLLSQLAEKASEADHEFAEHALALLADQHLETPSVAALETLVLRFPAFSKFVPFGRLFNGSAELKSRLMALNVSLLKAKRTRQFVPEEYMVWDPLEDPDTGDILLFALQIDYAGDLVASGIDTAKLRHNLHRICYVYTNEPSQLLVSSIIRTLARTAKANHTWFHELDTEFSLVTPTRYSLVAQLPAKFLVKYHKPVIEQLEPRHSSLAAVANIAQDSEGLALLPLSVTNLRNLPAPSQLLLAACATVSESGAHYFAERFGDCLKVACEVPDTPETSDYRATLRANCNRWKIKVRRDAEVRTA